jgi:hypothetical protein
LLRYSHLHVPGSEKPGITSYSYLMSHGMIALTVPLGEVALLLPSRS